MELNLLSYNICNILLHFKLWLFDIYILLRLFALFFKINFTSDQRISLPSSLFHLSQVHSGSKHIFFSWYVCYNFARISFLSDLNCAMVSCVKSIFCIDNIISLFRLPLAKISAFDESFNFKIFLCADLHYYSGLLIQVMNWFCSFWKIQHKIIQHEKYNTKKYSKKKHDKIQHKKIQHKKYNKKNTRKKYNTKTFFFHFFV